MKTWRATNICKNGIPALFCYNAPADCFETARKAAFGS